MKPVTGDEESKTEELKTTNPFSIMLEIARATYLEDILFFKADSLERTEVSKQRFELSNS